MPTSLEPWIINPAPLVTPGGGPKRVPPRAPADQEFGYLDKYDATTVFYDVFRCGRRVLAVGPPAGTLSAEVVAARVMSPDRRSVAFRSDPGLDRLGRFWAVPRGASAHTELSVKSRLSAQSIPVGTDLAERFAGRRAVMTVSKDNDLEWVKDWGRWYADHHGADALIVYNNNTTAYSAAELWETMARISGIAVAAVVDWPFKYGPVTRLQRFWDSDYAQRGALEHARWRLLRHATGFLNADIDELVIDPDGRSVFDAVAGLPSGVLRLPGAYTYPDPATPRDRRPRHADSYWLKSFPPEMPSAPKWCAVPARLPRGAQVSVHNVRGLRASQVPGFRFAHLLSITTNWYGARDSFNVVPEQYEIDTELRQRYDALVAGVPLAPHAAPSVADHLMYLPNRIVGFAWRLARRFWPR